jgi:hypothetical protein
LTTAHDQLRLRRMSDTEQEASIVATGLIAIGGDWAALRERHDAEVGGGTNCYRAMLSETESDPPFWLGGKHPEHAALFGEIARRWPNRIVLVIDWGTKPKCDYYLEQVLPANVQAVVDAALEAQAHTSRASEAADVAEAHAAKLQQKAFVAAKQARATRTIAVRAAALAPPTRLPCRPGAAPGSDQPNLERENNDDARLRQALGDVALDHARPRRAVYQRRVPAGAEDVCLCAFSAWPTAAGI